MRRLAMLCGVVVLLSSCKESSSDKAIREAKARPPDAGSVAPVPANATLLAGGQNIPRGLRADGTHLYWLNEGLKASGKPGVMRLAKSGGEPEVLLDTKGVEGVELTSDSVFAIVPTQEQVVKIPKTGGKPEVVAQTTGLSDVAADGENIYWTCEEGVVQVADAGGKPKTVVPGVAPLMGLAVGGDTAVWYSSISGQLFRAPVKRGKPVSLAKREQSIHQFIAHNGEIFWVEGSDKKAQLFRAPISGGAPTEVASGLRIPAEMTADDQHVYWTTGDEVMRVRRSGGSPETLVEKTDRSMGIAVDGSYVYWTDRGGRIQRVAR